MATRMYAYVWHVVHNIFIKATWKSIDLTKNNLLWLITEALLVIKYYAQNKIYNACVYQAFCSESYIFW